MLRLHCWALRLDKACCELFLEAGVSLGLAKSTAERLLENLRGRMVREAQGLFTQFETDNAQLVNAAPQLSVTMAREARCVRAIVHTVLKEMVRRLA